MSDLHCFLQLKFKLQNVLLILILLKFKLQNVLLTIIKLKFKLPNVLLSLIITTKIQVTKHLTNTDSYY